MLPIIGIVVVIGAILGGYLLEKGNVLVLMQPAELLIIGGSALGTLIIANPLPTLLRIVHGFKSILSGSKYNTAFYLETLKMLNEIFMIVRKSGMAALETHVEEPAKSALFQKYPRFLADHHAVNFVCDTLRMIVTGGVEAFDLDQMMELDMEVQEHEAQAPVAALTTMSDALPGLGIVAAVLGIVITMGALGGPPEEIGHKVAAALVGTFLGILLCYGFFGPLSSAMAKLAEAEGRYFHCLRVGIVSFAKGVSPLLAVEFARRTIPSESRPSFSETERTCKAKPAAEAKPAA
jgi:chemotaxis protein MotA